MLLFSLRLIAKNKLITLKECCHWLNKGFVYTARSVSQFVLLFQKIILFSSLCTLGIATT